MPPWLELTTLRLAVRERTTDLQRHWCKMWNFFNLDISVLLLCCGETSSVSPSLLPRQAWWEILLLLLLLLLLLFFFAFGKVVLKQLFWQFFILEGEKLIFPLLKLKWCFLHLKHQIVDRGIGKTPEIAKKCSVHPKFVGKSEKTFPSRLENFSHFYLLHLGWTKYHFRASFSILLHD